MQMKGKTLILTSAEAGALGGWLHRQADGGAILSEYVDPALVRCLGECLGKGHTVIVAADEPNGGFTHTADGTEVPPGP